MTRLNLHVLSGPHRASLAIGYRLDAVRLLTQLSLRTSSSRTSFSPVIVDTGAAVSLLPSDVWRGAAFQSIGRIRLSGVVAHPACQVEANLAQVDCFLSDGTAKIGPLTIHACLADSDRVPALLGVSGILDQVRLVVDLSQRTAFIESP